MNFLALAGGEKDDIEKSVSNIEKSVLESNPLLEAFGKGLI
jgi:myosin heavy subunit